MITLKRLMREVRKKIKDNNEIKFSDYELIDSINECLRYINQSYSIKNSDFLDKIKEYRQDIINKEIDDYNANLAEGELPKEKVDFATTGVELPSDYLTIVSIVRSRDGYKLSPSSSGNSVSQGMYKVFAKKLYMADDVDLFYKIKLLEVKDIELDIIDLPEIFIDVLVKVTCMILNNAETDILLQAVNDSLNNLVPRRRYSNIKPTMPFI